MPRCQCSALPRRSASGVPALFVAVDALAPFVLFLRFQRHRGDRARIEAFQGNLFSGYFAIAVFAVLDPTQRRIDLGYQLALLI